MFRDKSLIKFSNSCFIILSVAWNFYGFSSGASRCGDLRNFELSGNLPPNGKSEVDANEFHENAENRGKIEEFCSSEMNVVTSLSHFVSHLFYN